MYSFFWGTGRLQEAVAPLKVPGRQAVNEEAQSMKGTSLRDLLQAIHRDERGAVSLETILIIGAIAIPILIFLIKVGWPRIKNFFNQGLSDLEQGALDAQT